MRSRIGIWGGIRMSESIEDLKTRIFGYVEKNLMNRANVELMLALIEELKKIKDTIWEIHNGQR
jgi:hypothetical protein